LLENARATGRTKLAEYEAKQVLSLAGLGTPRESLAASEDQAVACAERIGFPVALKVSSPDILHKSDSGGVKLNLNDAASVRNAYRDITAVVQNAHRMRESMVCWFRR
jgi:acetyltransferase